jgi:beta-mannanase
VPSQGALLGAFVGTGTIAQLETTLGRKLAISHNFYGWTDDWTGWVSSTAQAGYLPLITWEAWTNGSVGIPLDDIINGAHDTMIRSRAQASLAVGQKSFLRWGHEMNGNWYPWDGFHNGANTAANAKYISAYRHIHDLFTAVGASNVLWVFSPNVDSVPGDAWNQWANYYPGDAYVDWLAFDGYNWGTVMTTSSWRTFPSMTSTIYAGLAAKGKPIMIPETASAEQGGDKAAWIAAILPALKASFPAIKALVWFHMNKETDWRVDSSPAARTSFVQMANDPYFNL